MSVGRSQDILIGPRTTVFALLQAYPFLEPFLLARVRGFEALAEERARTRWARVMTLDDVGVRLNVPWLQLVREIAAEVERGTGRPARVAHAPRRIVDDERRLGELRDIVAGSRGGRLAARDGGALARRHGRPRARRRRPRWTRRSRRRPWPAGRPGYAPCCAAAESGDGTLARRRRGTRSRRCGARPARSASCATGLKGELERLGGSPTRRRWRLEKPLVSRLVGAALRGGAPLPARAAGLVPRAGGTRRRTARRRCSSPGRPRRWRRSAACASPSSATTRPPSAETGARLVDALEDLLAQDERLLEPLALRHFSAGDWAAVRELEDGVGWGLIPAPPAWPHS